MECNNLLPSVLPERWKEIVESANPSNPEYDSARVRFALVEHENGIKNLLRTIQSDFMNIAFRLIEIDKRGLYRVVYSGNADNLCKNIAEYGRLKFGFSKTTVYNLINVAKMFCDEYRGINKAYENYGFSQLVELLYVPKKFHKYFDARMTVANIRELIAKGTVYVSGISGSLKDSTFKIPEDEFKAYLCERGYIPEKHAEMDIFKSSEVGPDIGTENGIIDGKTAEAEKASGADEDVTDEEAARLFGGDKPVIPAAPHAEPTQSVNGLPGIGKIKIDFSDWLTLWRNFDSACLARFIVRLCGGEPLFHALTQAYAETYSEDFPKNKYEVVYDNVPDGTEG